MIHPNGEPPGDDQPGDEDDNVQRSLDRFQGTLNNVEGHKRRLIDALGWWAIRLALAIAFTVLLVFSKKIEAACCAALFALSFAAPASR